MSTQPQPRFVLHDATAYPSVSPEDYVMMSPGGKLLKVTAQVFEALSMFLGAERKHECGSLEISCRNGGVAGVEVNLKLK